MGVATSSATFFRQMGGTLGTAVFLSVLFSTVGDKIGNAFRQVAPTPAFQAALRDPKVLSDPDNASVVTALRSGGAVPKGALDDTSFLSHLDPRLARPFLVGFSESIDLVFLCGAAVLVIALLVVLFLPEEPLRKVSGIQARQDDADRRTAAASAAAAEADAVPPAPGSTAVTPAAVSGEDR
jgi:hypothetical protein